MPVVFDYLPNAWNNPHLVFAVLLAHEPSAGSTRRGSHAAFARHSRR